MAVLIDTHVLVWSLFDARRLSAKARAAIDTADVVHVSAASIYEIDSKRRLGGVRSKGLERMPADMPASLPGLGFSIVDVTGRHAWLAANLPMAHGDPWDRILIAQARDLGVPLVSRDADLRQQAGHTPIIW